MKIKIYGKYTNIDDGDYCKWCSAAKILLESRGLPYEYQNILEDGFDIHNLVTVLAPGAKTVPIIFVEDQWIGGYDKLAEMINILAIRRNIEDAARAHAVKVVFEKLDGSIRTMVATLNAQRIEDILGPELPGAHGTEPKEYPLNILVVLDTETREWRSIPLERVKEVYPA